MVLRSSTGVKAVAIFEGFKGILGILTGWWFLLLVNRDVSSEMREMIEKLHLDPASPFFSFILDAAGTLTDVRLRWLAVGAAVYTLVRFIEAYGLWHERRWAKWFAALSGGIYLPFELYELAHGVTWLKAATLIINLIVVFYLFWNLRTARPQPTPTQA